MHINWYPGHMKKTKELIVENLKVVDLIIEILDARIPISSKNPDIEKLANNKKRIVVLNKVDLIDDKDLKKWEEYFLENKIADHFIAISVEKGTIPASSQQSPTSGIRSNISPVFGCLIFISSIQGR